jgi:protein-tyrosine-phosphatase
VVLFVCTFNRVRSPMAAGLMRRLYGETFQVDSCGLQAADAVDPLAQAVMAEVGVDLTAHLPKRLDQLVAERRFDPVVALSEEAWLRVQTVPDVALEKWPIPDPTPGEGSRHSLLEAYRLTRHALQTRIVERFGPPSLCL